MNPTYSCCSSCKKKSQNNITEHWDKAYNTNSKKLGWYERSPEPSLNLIRKCNFDKSELLLDVGVGTSTLIDELIKENYKNIIASDLSATALHKLQDRLSTKSKKVRWIVDDLTNSKELYKLQQIDLWHDRAVLHFFNENIEQDAYFNLLKKLVKKNGYVIIAAFNLDGATKCSELYVFRYNKEMLEKRLGSDFKIIESFDHTYTNPFGDNREYIYTLFKRINQNGQ